MLSGTPLSTTETGEAVELYPGVHTEKRKHSAGRQKESTQTPLTWFGHFTFLHMVCSLFLAIELTSLAADHFAFTKSQTEEGFRVVSLHSYGHFYCCVSKRLCNTGLD